MYIYMYIYRMDPYITNLESHTFLRGLSLLSQYEWYIRRCGLERSSWEVIFLYFSWRNDHVTPILFTYGGCEILHHQKDGWNPKKKGCFYPRFQLAQDFATIHRMSDMYEFTMFLGLLSLLNHFLEAWFSNILPLCHWVIVRRIS